MLVAQSNLATTYRKLGRHEQALSTRRDVYSITVKVYGEDHERTLTEASNYAGVLNELNRFQEVKSWLCKRIPVARRVIGENHSVTLTLRRNYARALYEDTGATLNDVREAVMILEDIAGTSRRVIGGAHPLTEGIESHLRKSRAALRARETLSSGSA